MHYSLIFGEQPQRLRKIYILKTKQQAYTYKNTLRMKGRWSTCPTSTCTLHTCTCTYNVHTVCTYRVHTCTCTCTCTCICHNLLSFLPPSLPPALLTVASAVCHQGHPTGQNLTHCTALSPTHSEHRTPGSETFRGGERERDQMNRALLQKPYSVVHTFDKLSNLLWLAKHSSAGNNE